MIGSWSNRIIEESRCRMRDRHALDATNLDVNYVALGLRLVANAWQLNLWLHSHLRFRAALCVR
jgi:hypothetical protein